MKKFFKNILVAFFICLLLVGCGESESVNKTNNAIDSSKNVDNIENIEDDILNESNSIDEKDNTNIDFENIKPNEAGQIMVLMYHNISQKEDKYARTADNFRKDLQVLYDQGYRPISLKDYATGNITTQAGYTPIVLTFDDGWQNNFNLIKDNDGNFTIDRNCAVSILEEFNREHPDFPLEATFFVNNNVPFGQKEYLKYKLEYIIDKGMDIGNHTSTHKNFKDNDVNSELIQKEIATVVEMLNKYIPDYQVDSLSLPFGSRPKNNELYTYLEKGSYNDITYNNVAIVNVGWDPYKSPYHIKFNPLAIHRVRASDLKGKDMNIGMSDWLEMFEKGDRVKFVSDGIVDVVSIPNNYEEVIDKEKIKDKELIIY